MFISLPISERKTSIIAIAALDDLVNDLVKASRLKIPPAFLDWIADSATPLVEQHVMNALSKPRFVNSLQMGDPKIAMGRWVLHWISPGITLHFPELTVHLPDLAQSRRAALPLVPARISFRMNFMPNYQWGSDGP